MSLSAGFITRLISILLVPLIGPLTLYFHRPESDRGELLAAFGWPTFYLLGGLVASYFDQPRRHDFEIGGTFLKLKERAHDLRVGWLFFLSLFEALAAIWVLAEYQLILVPFVVGAYVVYTVLATWWEKCNRRIRAASQDGGTTD